MDSRVCFASKLVDCVCRRVAISCAVCAAAVAAASSAPSRVISREDCAAWYCDSTRSSFSFDAAAEMYLRRDTTTCSAASARAVAT